MHFHFSEHKLLYATLRELRLQTEKFIVGKGPSKDTTVYVRGEHLRHQDLGGDKTPYKLHPDERKPVKQLQWYMIYSVYSKFYIKK